MPRIRKGKIFYSAKEVFTKLRTQKKPTHPYTQLDVFGDIVYVENMAYKKQKGGFWQPEKIDDKLEGEIMAVIDGEFGKQYAIKTDDGVITTPSHRVLQGLLVCAKESDKVKLVFTGEQAPTKKGMSPTKMYDVFIDE